MNPNDYPTTDAPFSTDDALDAVSSAKGVRPPVMSNNTTAKRAADGRVFVQFSTTHRYGRSNGLDALRELDDSFAMTYTPHGATQYAAQVGEGMSREDAEQFVTEGAEYVNARGFHVRITGFSKATETVEAEYPGRRFGDSRGEGRRERLVEQLVEGVATPLNAHEVLGDDDDEPELVTDGGHDVAEPGPRNMAADAFEGDDGYDALGARQAAHDVATSLCDDCGLRPSYVRVNEDDTPLTDGLHFSVRLHGSRSLHAEVVEWLGERGYGVSYLGEGVYLIKTNGSVHERVH